VSSVSEDPARRAARRPGKEVRALLLDAAAKLFAEHGYEGTKTREIAERAQVGESVIFRNFGSKAGLFEAVVVQPFIDAIDRWAASVHEFPPDSADPDVITRAFVVGFYDVAEEHRELLQTLIGARTAGSNSDLAEVAGIIGEHLSRSMLVVQQVLLDQMGARSDLHGLDPPVTTAATVGAILSLVLLGDWLLVPYGKRPSRERQIEELTQLLQHGVQHRGDTPAD
jgi:AcrR family transcriptional regulator